MMLYIILFNSQSHYTEGAHTLGSLPQVLNCEYEISTSLCLPCLSICAEPLTVQWGCQPLRPWEKFHHRAEIEHKLLCQENTFCLFFFFFKFQNLCFFLPKFWIQKNDLCSLAFRSYINTLPKKSYSELTQHRRFSHFHGKT